MAAIFDIKSSASSYSGEDSSKKRGRSRGKRGEKVSRERNFILRRQGSHRESVSRASKNFTQEREEKKRTSRRRGGGPVCGKRSEKKQPRPLAGFKRGEALKKKKIHLKKKRKQGRQPKGRGKSQGIWPFGDEGS